VTVDYFLRLQLFLYLSRLRCRLFFQFDCVIRCMMISLSNLFFGLQLNQVAHGLCIYWSDNILIHVATAFIGLMSIINLVAHGLVLMLLIINIGFTYWSRHSYCQYFNQ